MVRFHGLIITPSIDGSCNAVRKILSISAVKVDMILSLPLSSSSKLVNAANHCLPSLGNDDNAAEVFKGIQGIIVPGGFGDRGVEGQTHPTSKASDMASTRKLLAENRICR